MQYGDPVKPDNVKGGFGFKDNGVEEKNLYFYHPDHLGSSSYITDRTGKISQHTEYIVFGEVLFDEHTTENNMPYLFNGKELDSETGLYYYGARYYDAKTSIWLGTDPLSGYNPIMETEHYIDGQHNGGIYNPMNFATYSYTYQNPIKWIDPNGKQVLTYNIFGDNPTTSREVASQYTELSKPIVIASLGIADILFTGGWGSRAAVTYSTGSMVHSMEMQSHWRNKGNEYVAKKYEKEGANATRDLTVSGLFYGVSKLFGRLFVSTPYGNAYQSNSTSAMSARLRVSSGAKLYRVGTLGKSQAAEAQFWSLENPLKDINAYAKKYGIPVENIKNADFIEIGTLKSGHNFITRPAPAAPGSPVGAGGGIEVVTPPNSVKLETFSTLK
ncbi:RHS repeat domain-containing protein [Riemerella columbina]|uniref:RHS repeat domain-containing protein n=1 Tax=Riemerella columbina TaxID=103810 RepID=UPI0003630FE8|nr:RHS repeat-associated core domain-containing protein [Riemerella columbina]